MKIIFTVVFLIAGLSAFSQQRWIASFPQNLIGGGNGECICSDLDRNTIVGGTNIQKTPGGVLLKYDISGNLLWLDTDNITSFKKVQCIGNNIPCSVNIVVCA